MESLRKGEAEGTIEEVTEFFKHSNQQHKIIVIVYFMIITILITITFLGYNVQS